MDSYEKRFERKLVEEIVNLYSQQKLNHNSFAKLLYGQNSTAPSKWWKIRNISPTGKPQNLPFHEAIKAALILGIEPSKLLTRVQKKLKAKD